ncbi:MAG: hypothetical protein INR69_07060 [Mucilaginibacter polytrichastri]|nr:hypothetical protein [Mucilaginibacter polytrichastri]
MNIFDIVCRRGLGLFLFFGSVSCNLAAQTKAPVSVLDSMLSTTVYSNENLESVILRLANMTNISIGFRPSALLPFHAKAQTYHDVSLRSVLDNQLEDTPIGYRFQYGRIELYFKSEILKD